MRIEYNDRMRIQFHMKSAHLKFLRNMDAFAAITSGRRKSVKCTHKNCSRIVKLGSSGWVKHWRAKHRGEKIPPVPKKTQQSAKPVKPKPIRRKIPKKRAARRRKKVGGSKKGSVKHFHPMQWKLKRVKEYNKLKRGQKYRWLKRNRIAPSTMDGWQKQQPKWEDCTRRIQKKSSMTRHDHPGFAPDV